ncbi:ATP-binding protein [Streptomyces purpurascens]|uniref:ATP-binding protein n=1 Tax=Streptomyces purpurascens TaxID=1924 RepID=A0ABZ1MKJ2_STREF|nr:ATP-binding protein [Streptomyces purpurascens]MCE7051676.1 ATP-binding protein [Streptomyces purpurascens]GHA11626.1 ATP-binding protein [Streptomyces purpurascens]
MSPHTTSTPRFLDAVRPGRTHWLELPPHRTSVRSARHAMHARLDSWQVPDEVCANAVLLISELVTNAVLHTLSERILCGVGLMPDERFRLEVHDGDLSGRGIPDRRPGLDDENGRGLLLVREIAESWGITRSTLTGGNAVWASLATPL